jgi:hypothetical protein
MVGLTVKLMEGGAVAAAAFIVNGSAIHAEQKKIVNAFTFRTRFLG